ncbi:uncharacterized protein [Elaeis guineensis]|uniref:uncharacterized protein isoform X2 n=1 Tax=Elaeis guineensis var. tenera TaxID=51953 RepID=UPI003C6D4157
MALHLPFPSAETPALLHLRSSPKPPTRPQLPPADTARPSSQVLRLRRHLSPRLVVSVGKEETELRVSSGAEQQDASPEDLECVQQIQRVLELLTKNRDMLFGEIRLTIMIEDPRDTERKRLLGIEDPDGVTRDDLVAALDDVNEGRIPENRVALRLLAKEIMEWPDLEHGPVLKGPYTSFLTKYGKDCIFEGNRQLCWSIELKKWVYFP